MFDKLKDLGGLMQQAQQMQQRMKELQDQLERQEIDSEAYFQREVAPTMAAKWADRLRISVGGGVLQEADFTLASEYRYGGTIRVDFTVPVGKQYTREDLQQIVVSATDALPAGSVANLTRVSFHYYTDHFDTTAESVRASNDLNRVDTGDVDPQGALAILPLTAWEQQDLRRVIEDAVDEPRPLIAPPTTVTIHVAVPGPIAGPFTAHIAERIVDAVCAVCSFALGRHLLLR